MVNLHQFNGCFLSLCIIRCVIGVKEILYRNVNHGELLLVLLTEVKLVDT